MLYDFDKDLAAQCVKTIVDGNRCVICDKSDGARMRFACGHSACVDCVAVVGDCPTCTPSMDSSSTFPRSDLPYTERVKHATELLTSFQDTFEIDVYKRLRISERLKVEKELFPDCIQAPSTYFNKRKSLNVSSKKNGKENSYTFYPGEQNSSTMNKSSYVQDWLNKQNMHNVPSRSPFSELHVNTHHIEATPNSHTVKGKENLKVLTPGTRQSSRKRSRLKQSVSSNAQSNLENYMKHVEKSQSKKTWMSSKTLKQDLGDNTKIPGKDKVQDNRHCDESGIVIDDDCFTIEDTQDQIIDKDRLALLAVANADVGTAISSSVVEVEDSAVMHGENWVKESTSNDQNNELKAVPFYRKSYLFQNCGHCILNDYSNVMKPKLHDGLKNDTDISITVENKSFITTITVVDCHKSSPDKKQSISVQTDVQEPFLGFEQITLKEETEKEKNKFQDYIQSDAMFTEGIVPDTDSQKTTYTDDDVVLTQHDAEKNLAQGGMVADHHTEHGFGILTESGAGFPNRKRKPPRGVTPDSNNSSDKENFDPNRKKKNYGKKKLKK